MTGLVGALVPPPVKLALVAGPYAFIGALALLCWHFDARATANAHALSLQAEQFKAAQTIAAQRAQEALLHEQAIYQTKAAEADHAYQSQLAVVHASTDGYIASHRVQPGPVSRGPGAAAATSAGNHTSVSASVPTGAVLVSAGDVQICSDAVTYSLKAHDWASTINP